jgi:hypothetical protein
MCFMDRTMNVSAAIKTAHSFVDLGAVAPIFRQELHDRVVDFSIDHQKALVRLFSPFPHWALIDARRGSTS